MKVEEAFYQRSDVVLIARELLGKSLNVRAGDTILSGIIVETEAYSFTEKACHAYNNKRTARTETLFAQGGTSYVYLCYGIHRLFNVVTNVKGVAEAVLIRALEPEKNIHIMRDRRMVTRDTQLTSGPGKLSAALGIEMSHNNRSLLDDDIWIEHGVREIEDSDIAAATRIGVDYAGEDALLPWRFYLRQNAYISAQ